MSTFSARISSPSSVGTLTLAEGYLQYVVEARREVSSSKPCCPFCPYLKKTDDTAMPQMLLSCDIMGALRTGCQLQVLHMPMLRTKSGKRRVLKVSPWLEFESPGDASHAQRCIQQASCWGGQPSPRNLLVLLNPASGRGRSLAMWKSVERYICEAAGISCDVVESRAPYDFERMVAERDLSDLNGIVVGGGDGTMHEVLQGLLGRPDWASVAKVPLAQMPSGSGNALCASLRISDPVHAAFVIIKGVSHPVDAASILQAPNKRTFSFLTLTAGLLSNLDYGTNHLRWMGELRFTLGAIYEIMAKRKSNVRVKYLPKGPDSPTKPSADWKLETPEESLLESYSPCHGPSCTVLQGIPGVDMSNVPESLAAMTHLPGWKDIGTTAVQLLVAANIPWISTSYHLAPPACIDDGAYTLMWTTEATRTQGIDFLLKSEKGQHMDLPFLHSEKVSALLFEPISTDSWVLVDGELADMVTTYLEVHEGLLNVLIDPQTATASLNLAPDDASPVV
mmetsp:Transcript_46465/g.118600  ORF Transcript_46465/g.118600 Transcript_46465/m.118600 type:complete len:508 (+) Transcript_46465:317-1840(+)